MTRKQQRLLSSHQTGMSLIEAMLSLIVGALLVGSLVRVLDSSLDTGDEIGSNLDRAQDAKFALDRLEDWLRRSPLVLTPQLGRSGSGIAFALDPTLDSDGDGFADADNDRDGAVNEDPGADMDADSGNGWFAVDDDGDGQADETDAGTPGNDDEDGSLDEDPQNGMDDDGDGLLDEDWGADANGDGCAGLCGVDDDGDGSVDEGAVSDDDEDGVSDEDWIDTVGISQLGSELNESLPTPGAVSGVFRSNQVLISGVDQLLIERIGLAGGRERIDIQLDLLGARGDVQSYGRSVTRQSP